MKQPNDERYRKLLRSSLPAYDKKQEWEAIAAKLPAKRRPIAWLWWLVGAGILLLGALWLQLLAPDLGALPIPQRTATAPGEKAVQGDRYAEAEDIQEAAPAIPRRKLQEQSQATEGMRQARLQRSLPPLPNRIQLLSRSVSPLQETHGPLSPVERRPIGLLAAPPPLLPAMEDTESLNAKPAIHLQTGFGPLYRTIKADAPQEYYANAMRERETPLYLSHVQLTYRHPLRERVSLELGIAYLQLITRYRFEETTAEAEQIPSDSARFFTFPDGTTEYLPGELEQTTITERRVQQFNQFHQLGLSAGLRWQPVLFRKVPAFLRAHYAYYPLRWAEGRSLTPSLDYLAFDDPALEGTLAGQLSMLDLQAGVAWPFSASLRLETGFFYQRTLSNASAATGVSLSYQSWGGTLGLSFEF